MKISAIIPILIGSAFSLSAGAALGAGQKSCTEGKLCRLDNARSKDFKRGKLDGAAVWQMGGHAVVHFTTKTRKETVYDVAICGAKSVHEVKFEDGPAYRDEKQASPKGKLSGCDHYQLRTGGHIDGFKIDVKGKTFKLFVKMDGAAKGYAIYAADAELPAREDFYHFKLK